MKQVEEVRLRKKEGKKERNYVNWHRPVVYLSIKYLFLLSDKRNYIDLVVFNKTNIHLYNLMFFLTVHHSIDLFHLPTLMHNPFIQLTICYITILDMFRALTCSSSGGQIVLSQHLVSSLSVNGCTVCQMKTECRAVCPPEDGHVNSLNMSWIVM